jgi:hypothetical protein
MALRIEAWLGVDRGGEARLWLAEQSAFDLAPEDCTAASAVRTGLLRRGPDSVHARRL